MKYITASLGLLFLFASSNCAVAQSTDQQQEAQQTSFNETVDTPTKKIGFRLKQWKTIHTESAASASESMATLKKIGCEVVSNDHGNHVDVRFRCTEWKAMELPSDQLAAQWASWLIDKGMETVVVEPPADTKRPTVRYRMQKSKKLHIHDPAKAKEMVTTFQLIGVYVATNNHGNHIDATIHCPQWKMIELPSDENAHVWQKWLNDNGFETQHTH